MRNSRTALGAVVASVAYGIAIVSLTPTVSAADNPPKTTTANAQPRTAKSPIAKQAKTETTTIIAGSLNSTYLPIAYDIATVVETGNNAQRVMPILGKGSYQNVADLLHQKGIDIGLTQTNVLAHLKRTGELGKDIDRQIAYIAKLYNEEVHVLARNGIDNFHDLAGKRIHLGATGSGSDFTGRQLLATFNISGTIINGCETEAYHQLKAGKLDAVIIVAGKPVAPLVRHTASTGLKFLSIPFASALPADYLPAKLNHAAYPNIIPEGHTVDTVAVGAVLAVYNWPRKNANYARLERFIATLFNNFTDLKAKPRHPKWRETNLAAPLKGWQRFGPAKAWIDRVGKAMRQTNATRHDRLREKIARLPEKRATQPPN